MKELKEYIKNGHQFRLIKRTGDIAIFQGKPKNGKADTWEVIVIQSHHGREVHGTFYEPTEYPPSNEQWGSKGWTCANLESAYERFGSLVKAAMNG